MNEFVLWIIPAVFLIVILMLCFSVEKRKRQISALKLLFTEQQRQLSEMKSEIHELRCGTLGVGTRVQNVEGQLAQAIERQNEFATVNDDPQTKHYGHAMKMVELGASVDELVKECDLTRGEAELLVSLHSK